MLQGQADVAGREMQDTIGRGAHTAAPAGCDWAASGWAARFERAAQPRVKRASLRRPGSEAPPGRRFFSMPAPRCLVELRAGRDPACDGIVLAQVVESEADNRRVQHVVRVRVDLRPLCPLLARVRLGALLCPLQRLLCPLLRLLIHARRGAWRGRVPCDGPERESRCRGAQREQHRGARPLHHRAAKVRIQRGKFHVRTAVFRCRSLFTVPPPHCPSPWPLRSPLPRHGELTSGAAATRRPHPTPAMRCSRASNSRGAAPCGGTRLHRSRSHSTRRSACLAGAPAPRAAQAPTMSDEETAARAEVRLPPPLSRLDRARGLRAVGWAPPLAATGRR